MDPAENRLEPLLEAGRLLSSQLDLPRLLKTVLELAAKVVGAETASLLLLDERTQELYFDVALGLDEKSSRTRLKMGQGVAGSVARDRKAAIIDDARSDPRWSSAIDSQSGFSTRSILAVPLLFQRGLIGVLEAINKRGGPFDEADRRTFEAFASQAAVAIQNARLFATLKEESFKLSTILSAMADAAVLVDASGNVLFANPSASRLLEGSRAPRTIGAALEGFRLEPALPDLMKSGSGEFTAERQQPKLLILAGAIARLDDGGWLCVFRDETSIRRRERLKRTFLSLISHKLRTPLAAVIGFSDVLESELRGRAGFDGAHKAARSALKEGRKLAGLVEKLLRYTTLESGEQAVVQESCAVDALIDAALADLREWLAEQGARVERTKAGGLSVSGDPDQLREALKDLIENAVKFNPKPVKPVTITAQDAPGSVVLRVSDDGPGIAPEDQQAVFSRFHQVEASFTGQVSGLGLGLPYVKKVVERHGGTVELESRLGSGTTVILRLPRGRA